jgi:hypothetical protein
MSVTSGWGEEDLDLTLNVLFDDWSWAVDGAFYGLDLLPYILDREYGLGV